MTTQLHVTALGLPGVLLLKSIVHADARGSFTQSWQAADWRAAGVDIAFMQDNLVCTPAEGRCAACTGSVSRMRRPRPCSASEERSLTLWQT